VSLALAHRILIVAGIAMCFALGAYQGYVWVTTRDAVALALALASAAAAVALAVYLRWFVRKRVAKRTEPPKR